MMLTQKMESYIFKLAKKGNRKAFGDLIDMYKDSAFTLVHQLMNDPIEAEKIVIRTFLLLHSQLNNLPVEAKPSTVIYQFCIKLCMEKIKSEGKLEKVQENQLPLPEITLNIDMPDLKSKLAHSIHGMPIIHKTVVILKYVMNLSLAEISDILQVNTQNAKTYLRDGREYLSLQLSYQLIQNERINKFDECLQLGF
ncbi:RNA polymerase sigma-70 factor (ECF subfamily) [Paenibacillus sp. PastF-1]|uniref:RNA polymerase sigma factor 70 region 4 type 2 domain-containing protein n=2 Tax=Paenibacillus TaxID=44249 RepID=A0ABX7LKE7_9BACL|nr:MULTISPECIES: sigma factor-like helix-turn-helix DNA-binding protein [Paenibacillus]MDF9839638.1 RNA polymerase sigma-70 factor (ECF subfamily) [Paenibacillus sp. PastF-2]MDF9846219.1 RNA polymerase sigma-70 factor (ECF subfamily) [Paenibacillus sp. PastM-2]MDF9852791.1 RNA polymerase sigma-70 factor (ECF subfamily) [Paenibacillus sp. PastF-1]MDH6477479.1 RNA polymerase sigma-70 factor (ECF subfamily) [Paenibacillus sp. PastH-2]QSF47489.1 hypothetical protein JRJ22_13510 [Paenibacillus tian